MMKPRRVPPVSQSEPLGLSKEEEKKAHTESNLLNLGEIVLGILVQRDLPNSPERVIAVRPDMSQVKDVDSFLFPSLLRLFLGHGLDLHRP